jgi:hypothetical protein
VVLGFLPQLFAFYLPFTRQQYPDWLASGSLVLSQLTLLAFGLVNLRLPGMPLLIFGLGCNLVVILANGGFMPLPVETASRLVSPHVMDSLEVGGRIGYASKDILLPGEQISLPFLSDRFVSPAFFPYRFAFSIGDVFIGIGAFWLLVQGQSVAVTS